MSDFFIGVNLDIWRLSDVKTSYFEDRMPEGLKDERGQRSSIHCNDQTNVCTKVIILTKTAHIVTISHDEG